MISQNIAQKKTNFLFALYSLQEGQIQLWLYKEMGLNPGGGEIFVTRPDRH
jgi:hypothetical protein